MIPVTPALDRRLRWLQHALARTLDADLAGIHLAIVPNLPVDGFAYGNLVALSARLVDRPRAELLRAAIHEVVHVFQQRAGRVPPRGRSRGIAFACDATLEAEAEAAACSAGRRPLVLRATGAALPGEPVLQPLISVGGRAWSSEPKLPDEFARLLALIPAGPAWLSWALRSPSPSLSFANEFALLTAIQLGLHGTGEVCFQSAGVRLAPALLLTLGRTDGDNLIGSLETGQLTPAAHTALARLAVRTEADFARLDATLAQLGSSSVLPLTAPTLAEQVNLYARFIATPPPADAPALDAAEFAAGNAQTATDFAAAFAFYLAVRPEPNVAADLPAQIWTQLTPVVFPYLQCPTMDPLSADAAVVEYLSQRLPQPSSIGFPSLAVALAGVAAAAGLSFDPSIDPADAAGRIRSYLLGLTRLVAPLPGGGSPQPAITRLQDGLTRWIDYSGANGSARFQLDPTGLLSLRSFHPVPPS